MLHRILRKFEILLEISQCLTEISSKFIGKGALPAKIEPRSLRSFGYDQSLTLDPFERLLALRSAFGCPPFCFSSAFTSILTKLCQISRSVLSISISEGEGGDERIRSHAHAPPMRVKANARMPVKCKERRVSLGKISHSFRKLRARKIVKSSNYDSLL